MTVDETLAKHRRAWRVTAEKPYDHEYCVACRMEWPCDVHVLVNLVRADLTSDDKVKALEYWLAAQIALRGKYVDPDFLDYPARSILTGLANMLLGQ